MYVYQVSGLVREGMELGHADDAVFKESLFPLTPAPLMSSSRKDANASTFEPPDPLGAPLQPPPEACTPKPET